MDDNKGLQKENFGLVLVEKGRHYGTHLVNNDGEEHGLCCHDMCRP